MAGREGTPACGLVDQSRPRPSCSLPLVSLASPADLEENISLSHRAAWFCGTGLCEAVGTSPELWGTPHSTCLWVLLG